MLGSGLGYSSGRSFSLTDIVGLSLYYQNNVGITTAQWDDKSGGGRNASQTNSSHRATIVNGGYNFDGTDDHYDFVSVDMGAGEGFTLFIVCKLDAADARTILGIGSTGDFLEFQTDDAVRVNFSPGGSTIINPVGENQWATDKVFLLTLTRDAGGTGNLNVYKNGVLLDQSSQAANAGSASFDVLGSRGPDRFFDGVIYEIAVYEKLLNEIDLDKVHNYLTKKLYDGVALE